MLTFLLTIFSSDLEQFIEKPIKIVFSAYNHITIAESLSGNFIGISRFLSPTQYNYDDKSKIIKNGKGFIIQVGSHNLCSNKDELIPCKDNPGIWTIKKQIFGYNLILDSKCLTQLRSEKLGLVRCDDGNDKLFVFKMAGTDECKKKLQNQPTINIMPVKEIEHSIGIVKDRGIVHKKHKHYKPKRIRYIKNKQYIRISKDGRRKVIIKRKPKTYLEESEEE